jgi:bifunctional DNA-binding transcriptional regulator/antitoxin component of YhaV-PrlF toxin-antitoxin module
MGTRIMSGVSAKQQPRPRITVRSRLRPKAQLTLPEEIRRALRVSEGDEIEFAVDEDGMITARGFVSIPSDQIRYFAPPRQAGKRQPNEEIVAGGEAMHGSAEPAFARLDNLGATDA